jgi:hypothetical protein
MRARAALVVSLVVWLVAIGAAQEALPPARKIIDRSVGAIGGREVMARHTSRHATGRISMPGQGVEGEVDIIAARPDLMRLRITLPGVGEIQSGYDGRIGWSLDPMSGPMLLQGKALEQTKMDADFDASLHTEKQFKLLETVERTMFEGRPAYKIKAVRQSGEEDLEFFDVENGLMLGAMVTRESPMGPVKATHITSEYKEFGGMKIPVKIVQRMMGIEQVITITSVQFNTVDKAAFVPPPQIQALVK